VGAAAGLLHSWDAFPSPTSSLLHVGVPMLQLAKRTQVRLLQVAGSHGGARVVHMPATSRRSSLHATHAGPQLVLLATCSGAPPAACTYPRLGGRWRVVLCMHSQQLQGGKGARLCAPSAAAGYPGDMWLVGAAAPAAGAAAAVGPAHRSPTLPATPGSRNLNLNPLCPQSGRW
jgi:hypothetical protein